MMVSFNINSIKEYFPNLEINKIQVNNEGWDHEVVIVNNNLVFRFPKTEHIRDKMVVEECLLKNLKRIITQISLPNYKVIKNDKGVPVFGSYKYLNGKPISSIKYKETLKSDTNAKAIADFLSALHSLDYYPLKKLGLDCTYNREYWMELYNKIEGTLFKYLTQWQKEDIRYLFDNFFNNNLYTHYKSGVIHGDLTDSNILIEKSKVTGIIDFTDTQIFDPAFDFAGFYWDLGPEFTEKILKFYHGKENIDNLYYRVKHFYGIQPIFHEMLHHLEHVENFNIQDFMEKYNNYRCM
ncbi:phosphotransferase [Bacillus safensis]|uniref:phosphotransferase n=1 Tax=Bacillus TaxID=1386 RepID=UPI0025709644|nr:phosphotransferase [Bacillus safensis]WJE39895.1 phosphotransferase [Bacillus safensis]